jgi:hypothetical protein
VPAAAAAETPVTVDVVPSAPAAATAARGSSSRPEGPPVNTRGDERPTFAENRPGGVVPPPVDPAPAPPPQAAAAAKLEVLPGLSEPAPPAPRVVAGAEGIAPPEAAARSAEALTALPSAPSPEPANIRSNEQGVRAALGRYESAYNRLDAVAAAAVWPTVNQRALASAFNGLSAQAISLGSCEIRVNGAAARAECAGNARWTPKVGSGTESADRHWRFDLRNAGGHWIITQATTR